MYLIPRFLEIVNFRNFRNVKMKLGTKITLISGQNGVGKSNIVSLISSGSGSTKKGILGSNFQPEFYDFFNIDKSENFSEYKLYLHYYDQNNHLALVKRLSFKDDTSRNRGIRIIPRTSGYGWSDVKTLKQATEEGKRQYGVGEAARVPIPTIYLSISRLYPLGEKKETVSVKKISKKNKLYRDEVDKIFKKWYNAVIPQSIGSKDELSLIEKKTSSRSSFHMDMVNTPPLSQSVGQDNVGNIISALIDIYLLSKEEDYAGALICIDEVEVSLHPDTQLRLLNLFEQLAESLKIQFILSTHSLTFLKEMLRKTRRDEDEYSVVYIKNPSMPSVVPNISYEMLKADLFNKMNYNKPKPKIYFEDEVGKKLFQLLNIAFENLLEGLESGNLEYRNLENQSQYDSLKKRILELKYVSGIEQKFRSIVTNLGCENLLCIARADTYFKRVVFMLDGDARIKEVSQKPKINEYLDSEFYRKNGNERKHDPNICFLPGVFAPESYIFKIVYEITQNPIKHSNFWRGLDEKEETELYTSDKISMIFSDLPDQFNNDDLKKCFNDSLWNFIEKSNIFTYYYADYKKIEELIQYMKKLKVAYDMTLPLTLSNRYS